MLIGILLALQIIVSVALVGVVLLQRSEGSGFVGGGGSAGMLSVRGAGDLLTRTTWILGSSFFVISLLLTILAGREKGASSVVDRLKIDSVDPAMLISKRLHGRLQARLNLEVRKALQRRFRRRPRRSTIRSSTAPPPRQRRQRRRNSEG